MEDSINWPILTYLNKHLVTSPNWRLYNLSPSLIPRKIRPLTAHIESSVKYTRTGKSIGQKRLHYNAVRLSYCPITFFRVEFFAVSNLRRIVECFRCLLCEHVGHRDDADHLFAEKWKKNFRLLHIRRSANRGRDALRCNILKKKIKTKKN